VIFVAAFTPPERNVKMKSARDICFPLITASVSQKNANRIVMTAPNNIFPHINFRKRFTSLKLRLLHCIIAGTTFERDYHRKKWFLEIGRKSVDYNDSEIN
jgi:hypothetical protein